MHYHSTVYREFVSKLIEEMTASVTGGVKAFSLEGRLYKERERLTTMTEEERDQRAQWVRDQTLSDCEPVPVPELHKELYNPIRRLYWVPLDLLGSALKPVLGEKAAHFTRVMTGKLLMGVCLLYAGAYYFKYNANDWTRKGGWHVLSNRPSVYPGDPKFPQITEKSQSDYGTRGFQNSPI